MSNTRGLGHSRGSSLPTISLAPMPKIRLRPWGRGLPPSHSTAERLLISRSPEKRSSMGENAMSLPRKSDCLRRAPRATMTTRPKLRQKTSMYRLLSVHGLEVST